MTRAARTAAAVVAAPSGALAARAATTPAERPLALEFCEGIDMEHQEILAKGGGTAALKTTAEEHAGAPLKWEEGETEGCVSFAVHPDRIAEYLIVVDTPA